MAIPRFKKFQIWSACSSCHTCMADIYKSLQTIVCRNPVWNIVPWQVVAFHEVGRCYIWTSQPLESSSHQTKLRWWWQRSHTRGLHTVWRASSTRGKWSKYAPVMLQLMHRLKFSRQLPHQPEHCPISLSGCAEGKILNQIDVGKKLPAGAARAVFIDTS